jgi:hypothetical protein
MPDQSRRSVRDLILRIQQAIGRTLDAPAVDPATEPCLGCGEPTAIGSVFYSDRHVIHRADSANAFLCSLCDARLRSSRKGSRLTDEEVRAAVENGSAGAYLWGGGGPIVP